MKIELKEIKISEVANGYFNDNEEGVVGFGGILNIRPKYQREFVYKDKQRDEMLEMLQYLNRRGGLGLDIHNKIEQLIKQATEL